MKNNGESASAKILKLERRIGSKLGKALPEDEDSERRIRCRILRAKYIEYLRESAEVESLIDDLDLEDENIEFVNERAFYKKLNSSNGVEHSFLFDGEYIKLVGFYNTSFLSPNRIMVFYRPLTSL